MRYPINSIILWVGYGREKGRYRIAYVVDNDDGWGSQVIDLANRDVGDIRVMGRAHSGLTDDWTVIWEPTR